MIINKINRAARRAAAIVTMAAIAITAMVTPTPAKAYSPNVPSDGMAYWIIYEAASPARTELYKFNNADANVAGLYNAGTGLWVISETAGVPGGAIVPSEAKHYWLNNGAWELLDTTATDHPKDLVVSVTEANVNVWNYNGSAKVYDNTGITVSASSTPYFTITKSTNNLAWTIDKNRPNQGAKQVLLDVDTNATSYSLQIKIASPFQAGATPLFTPTGSFAAPVALSGAPGGLYVSGLSQTTGTGTVTATPGLSGNTNGGALSASNQILATGTAGTATVALDLSLIATGVATGTYTGKLEITGTPSF